MKMINIPFEDYKEMRMEYGKIIFVDEDINIGTVSSRSKLGNTYRMNIYEDSCRVRIDYDTTFAK